MFDIVDSIRFFNEVRYKIISDLLFIFLVIYLVEDIYLYSLL